MTSPAEDIAQILEDGGIGTIGTDIFIGTVPDTQDAPAAAIGVMDTGALFLSPKWKRDELTVQVLIRGPERAYTTGYAKAKAVMDTLLGIQPVTVNAHDYVLFVILGGIAHLGNDKQDRAMFSLNFKVVLENVPGGVRSSF